MIIKNKTTKMIISIIVIVLFITIGYLMVKSSDKTSSSKTVKIGVIVPLTGTYANVGQGIADAVLLAKEDLGETKYNYEVIFEDAQFDAKKTDRVVNKLINIDNVDVIISYTSGIGNAVAPIAEENKIIHFGTATSDPNVAKGDYNFIHWTPPFEESKVLNEELQKRGIGSLSVFVLNQSGYLAIANALVEGLKETNISVMEYQMFNFGEKDFSRFIIKAKQSDADIYVLLTFSPELDMLASQIREAGIDTPFTSIEAFVRSGQRELFEGEWFVDSARPTAYFIDKFKEKTGNDPPAGAANSYDIFNLVVIGYEEIVSKEKPSTHLVAEQLTTIKGFSGALGGLNINEDGIVVSKAVVRIIKDGELVTISDSDLEERK